MAQTFQQLLKEYPKSSAVAQANYYIGKAAFDGKEYKRAITSLDAARRLNREQYYNPATLRIILAHYYLRDRKSDNHGSRWVSRRQWQRQCSS